MWYCLKIILHESIKNFNKKYKFWYFFEKNPNFSSVPLFLKRSVYWYIRLLKTMYLFKHYILIYNLLKIVIWLGLFIKKIFFLWLGNESRSVQIDGNSMPTEKIFISEWMFGGVHPSLILSIPQSVGIIFYSQSM